MDQTAPSKLHHMFEPYERVPSFHRRCVCSSGREIRKKVIVIGSSGVGKTCFIKTFQNDWSSKVQTEYPATIEIDYCRKLVNVDGEQVQLDIWDTSGEEKSSLQLFSSIYRNTDAAIVMYDVTRRQTFREVNYWADQATKVSSNDDLILILVGNKRDMMSSRQVTVREARILAKNTNMESYDASSFQKQSVDDIFMTVVKKFVAAKKSSTPHEEEEEQETIKLTNNANNAKEEKVPWYKKCCQH